MGNYSVANAVTGGLFSTVRSLPSTMQPRTAGTTLGQIAQGLSFQPAVDELVLPAEWQDTLQGIAPQQPQPQTSLQRSQWGVDTQGRWVWERAEDRELWYAVQPDGSLRCLNTEPDVPQDEDFSPCCVVFAPRAAHAGSPSSSSSSRRDHCLVRFSTWWGGGLTQVTPVCWGLRQTCGC